MRTRNMALRPWRMPAVLMAALIGLMAGCGTLEDETLPQAGLSVQIDIPAPYLPYAAMTTALAALEPTSLAVMVCNDITDSTPVPCNRGDARTYNAFRSINLTPGMDDSSGGLEVPYGEHQVVFVQGINADRTVTYQGYATLPTIKPRAHYTVEISLAQVAFPPRLPPEPPVILSAPDNPYNPGDHNNKIVITGEREGETRMKVVATPTTLLGGAPFRNLDPNDEIYSEELLGNGRISWTLTLESNTSTRQHKLEFFSILPRTATSPELESEPAEHILCYEGFC